MPHDYPSEIQGLLAAAEAAAIASPSPPPSLQPRPVRQLRPVVALMAEPPATCCSTCEASLWFSTSAGPSCFCRITHTLTLTPEDPTLPLLLDCDQMHESPTE